MGMPRVQITIYRTASFSITIHTETVWCYALVLYIINNTD